ncbi:MAG: class I SAM-dependent methyltransferase [Myxococcota bacterium]|nr:class I SAM-dependent methyltransferase [Myxococcota bacterium]
MALAQVLDDINRRFYDRFADHFSKTRAHGWTGWHAALDSLPERPLRILDLGCGNGRLSAFMETHWCKERQLGIEQFDGLERCSSLLEVAQRRTLSFPTRWSEWSWSDVISEQIEAPLRVDRSYDWVVMFGVMHHIYGYQRRLRLLNWAAQHLRPGGLLCISLWDFGAHEKWQKKIIPWATQRHLTDAETNSLEAGDYLLGWAGTQDTPRYCHWVSREEEKRLLKDVGCGLDLDLGPAMRIGDEGDLNRYWTWQRQT